MAQDKDTAKVVSQATTKSGRKVRLVRVRDGDSDPRMNVTRGYRLEESKPNAMGEDAWGPLKAVDNKIGRCSIDSEVWFALLDGALGFAPAI